MEMHDAARTCDVLASEITAAVARENDSDPSNVDPHASWVVLASIVSDLAGEEPDWEDIAGRFVTTMQLIGEEVVGWGQ